MITEQLSNILKLFLPSWNFFNDFSAVPRLDARTIRDGHESDWQPLYSEHSTHNISRVIFNARGNLELLEKTFIDHAADEFSEPTPLVAKRFEQSALHETLIRILCRRMATAQAGDEFQFRLVMTNPGKPEDILFMSARHPAHPSSR